jgi:transcriptional regulator with XRE-family HTH domain
MQDSGFSGVAEYLLQRREQKSLSQEMLAEKLAAFSNVFDGIDGLAISRWERGVVSPNIERQVTLMEFFGDQPHLLLRNAKFELKQLPSLGAFHKWMAQNLLFNHVMGGHPYSADDEINYDKSDADHKDLPLWLRLICRYNENLTRGRELWSEAQLKALVTHASSHSIFYSVDRQLLGHVILLKVDDSTLDALLSGRMTDADLRPEQLLEEDAVGNLYIYSIYFGTRSICVDGLTHAFQTLIESQKNKAIGFKARATFGVKLMDLLAGEVVGRGAVITGHRDGARHNGKYLEYVSYRLKRHLLLTNPTMLNLVRQVATEQV